MAFASQAQKLQDEAGNDFLSFMCQGSGNLPQVCHELARFYNQLQGGAAASTGRHVRGPREPRRTNVIA